MTETLGRLRSRPPNRTRQAVSCTCLAVVAGLGLYSCGGDDPAEERSGQSPVGSTNTAATTDNPTGQSNRPDVSDVAPSSTDDVVQEAVENGTVAPEDADAYSNQDECIGLDPNKAYEPGERARIITAVPPEVLEACAAEFVEEGGY